MKKMIGFIKKAAVSYMSAITKAYNNEYYMYGTKCQKKLTMNAYD